jgi:hypothetical protein
VRYHSFHGEQVDRVSTQDEVRFASHAPGKSFDVGLFGASPPVSPGGTQQLLLELNEEEIAYVVDLLSCSGESVH